MSKAKGLSGRVLHGDDLDAKGIEAWFEDEREGYAGLGAHTDDPNTYGYHALNEYHCFRYLPTGGLGDALGVGSSFGHEFDPIVERLNSLTILEPSAQLRSQQVGTLVPRYIEPAPDGKMPFETASFDLVVCFGVLHHIPNVSAVIAEMARVARPGGWVLLREPIHSMGDWAFPRPGLTARERGIPLRLFRDSIERAGLRIERQGLCMFSLTTRIARLLRVSAAFCSGGMVRLDSVLATATRPVYRYHATAAWRRVRPTAAAYVLRR
jgi:SAM-dependent methyltransferase